MKFKILFLLSILASLGTGNVDAEKLGVGFRSVMKGFPRPGLGIENLAFYLSFQNDLNADYSRGKGNLLNDTESWTRLSSKNGLRGSCLSASKKPVVLQYSSSENLNGPSGTLSFWFRAGNWSLLKSGWMAPGTFFRLRWKDKRSIILRNDKWDTLFFVHDGNTCVRTPLAHEGKVFFSPEAPSGKWFHFVIVWKYNETLCYINGEKKAVIQLKKPFGADMADYFVAGCPRYSSVDEFKFFDRSLTDAEVNQLYQFTTAPPQAAAVSVPFLNEIDWRKSSSWTGLVDRLTGQISNHPSTVSVGFDRENLYFRFLWKVPSELAHDPVGAGMYGSLTHNVGGKDSRVWEDDSFEVHLKSPGGDRYRIVANDRRAVYDAKNGNASWDSNVKVFSEANLEKWEMTLSIPLKSLGGIKEGDKWKFNVLRNGRMCGLAYESFFVNPRAYYPETGADLMFAGPDSGVHIRGLQSLKKGSLELEVRSREKFTLELKDTSGDIKEIKKSSGDKISLSRRLKQGNGAVQVKVSAQKDNKKLFEFSAPYAYSVRCEISSKFIPTLELMELGILLPEKPAKKDKSIVLNVEMTQKEKSIFKKTFPLAEKYDSVKIDTQKFRAGDYELNLEVLKNGKKLLSGKIPFKKKERPIWLGNKYGRDDIVLRPWKPISRDGNKIKVWNREFMYSDKLLFPEELLSGGQSLFARPAELLLDGKELRGKNVIQSCTPTNLRRNFTAECGSVKVEASSTLEYDGMEWYRIKISPINGKSGEVSKLKLVIPFKKDVAELYYTGLRTAGNFKKMPCNMPFTNMLMLRNDLHGLIWFAESAKGYSLKRPNSCIQWKNTDDSIELIINMIDHPVKITGTKEIEFGLLPTPIKPAKKGWRKIRIGKLNNPDEAQPPLANYQFWWNWIGKKYGDSGHRRLWNDLSPPYDDLKTVNSKYIKAGIIPTPYMSVTKISPFVEPYRYFEEDWRIEPSQKMNFDTEVSVKERRLVCPQSTYSDYFFYRLKSALKGAGFQGLYFDCSGPVRCSNPYHGCGYIDDNGKRQQSKPYLATREFYKRACCLLQESAKDNEKTLIVGHPNPTIFPCSFLDVALTGENFVLEAGKHGNYHWIPLDQFRALMAPHTGIVNFFLPQFSRARKMERDLWYSEKKRPEVEHVCGLIMAHDAKVWPAYSINEPYIEMWKVQDIFGWDENTEFIPYWNNKNYVSVQGAPEGLVVSLYRRPGKLMVVILNHSNKHASVKISFKAENLGLKLKDAAVFCNPVSGEKYKMKDGSLSIPLKKWSYKTLIYNESP